MIRIILVCTALLTVSTNEAFAVTSQQENDITSSERTLKTWESGVMANAITIPRAAIYDKEGREVLLKDFKGNVAILVFWASWCLQCMNELLTLNQLQKDLAYHDVSNIKIIAVSTDFRPQEFQINELENHKITDLNYYMDKNKSLSIDLQVHSLPTSFVVDHSGQIIYKFTKHLNWADEIIYDQLAIIAGNTVQQQTTGVKNESDNHPN